MNKFLLARDKCMPEIHEDSLDLGIVLLNYLWKTKKEYKSLKRQEI